MFCSFGLGVSLNYVWVNLKALNETIERMKREQQEFEKRFKQSTEQIVKEIQQPATDDLKAQVLKKKHGG
jgi:predicted transcriptional regulator